MHSNRKREPHLEDHICILVDSYLQSFALELLLDDALDVPHLACVEVVLQLSRRRGTSAMRVRVSVGLMM